MGHFRSIWPAQEIQKNHSDEFEVDIRLNQPITEDDIGKYDLVTFHRRINKAEDTVEWINKLKDGGAILIGDMDDYWIPFFSHPAREMVIKNNVHGMIVAANKAADYVTTTTEIYAKYIRNKINKNVHIIPNAIDTEMNMWKPKPVESDKVRIAWIGGSSHARDLDKLKGTINKLFSDKDIKDKIQIVMCGYDTRGTVTEVNSATGEEKTRKITPEESIWNNFELIFNNDGKCNAD